MKIFLLVSVSICSLWGYFIPLNRPYTQKDFSTFSYEANHHQQIESNTYLTSINPQACNYHSSKICDTFNISYSDSTKFTGLKFIAGSDYRFHKEYSNTTKSIDGGIIVGAKHSFMDLYLDARLFTELHSNDNAPSYDREFVDKQTEDVNNQASFTSYGRYRGNMNFYFDIGIVSIARDAISWGPGVYNNMVFNQNAIPFNHLTYQTQIGPLKIISLYGSLLIENKATSSLNKNRRDLYAHRYELALLNDLTVGISEQMVLYKNNQPFLFVPFVPLFIEKSLIDEESNNGNLSLDVSYRFKNIALIYSELFIDDMESPGSLFTKDFIQNKWGLLIGSHVIYDINNFSNGFILEYARLEPYSYTHFFENQAQTAHQEHPLGNQLGPNSQNIIAKIYTRYKDTHYFSLKFDATWKGNDYGSNIEDLTPGNHTAEDGKTFLKDVSPEYSLEPYFSTQWKFIKFESSFKFAKNNVFIARLSVYY